MQACPDFDDIDYGLTSSCGHVETSRHERTGRKSQASWTHVGMYSGLGPKNIARCHRNASSLASSAEVRDSDTGAIVLLGVSTTTGIPRNPVYGRLFLLILGSRFLQSIVKRPPLRDRGFLPQGSSPRPPVLKHRDPTKLFGILRGDSRCPACVLLFGSTEFVICSPVLCLEHLRGRCT